MMADDKEVTITAALAGVEHLLSTWNKSREKSSGGKAPPGNQKKNDKRRPRPSNTSPTTQLAIQSSDLYRLGLVLSALQLQLHPQQQQQQSQVQQTVQRSYHELLVQLPGRERVRLFDCLLQGLLQLLQQQQQDKRRTASSIQGEDDEWIQAVSAVVALYRSSKLAGASTNATQNLMAAAIVSYTRAGDTQNNNKNGVSAGQETVTLDLMACLLLQESRNDVVNHRDDKNNKNTATIQEEEDKDASEQQLQSSSIVALIHQLQEEPKIWHDLVSHLHQYHPGWKDEIMSSTTNTATGMDAMQRDYLRSLLDHDDVADKEETLTWNHPDGKVKSSSAPATTSRMDHLAVDPLQESIDQVRAILPNLGEGFVEVALTMYKGRVDETVSALLLLQENPDEARKELPTQLLVADRSLPRRRPKTETAAATRAQEEEAKQVAKATILAAERQEEKEARLVHHIMTTTTTTTNGVDAAFPASYEYNDDYDDQWDADGDGGAGTMANDSGLYDDYQAVKTYNRVYREVEAEDQFWHQNRNTNREQPVGGGGGGKPPKHKKTAEGDEQNDEQAEVEASHSSKTFRGPDKLRGGRIPNAGGRGRGGRSNSGGGRGRGRGGRGQETTNDNTTTGVGGGAARDNDTSSNNNDSTGNSNNARRKARNLANRREQQKKAMYKRSG